MAEYDWGPAVVQERNLLLQRKEIARRILVAANTLEEMAIEVM